jgi:protein SCO1/2
VASRFSSTRTTDRRLDLAAQPPASTGVWARAATPSSVADAAPHPWHARRFIREEPVDDDTAINASVRAADGDNAGPSDPTRQGPMNRRFAFGLAAGFALVAAVGAIEIHVLFGDPAVAPRAGDSAPAGGPFSLIDASGVPVTDKTYRGKWELVFFGYTYCPDLCPTTLTTIADALRDLGPLADKVQPIFITVDPQRDTPAAVGDYVRNFDPRIVGLTGSAEAIAAVAKEYKVYYAVHKTGDGPDDYLMDHSGFIYLMDPNGRFVGVLSGEASAQSMADKLRPLLSPRS